MNMLSILSIIASLSIIECLLSIDNALVLAAIVSHLPRHQQKVALRVGLGGAYAMRGLCMFFVNFLISHWWIKTAAALYLLYLMCKNLSKSSLTNSSVPIQCNLFGTIVMLELADLAFSADNIATAVAFSTNFWAVCIGVFIGIAAIRFAAGWCIQLMNDLPVLANIAYVLVGSVGVQLLVAQIFRAELPEVLKLVVILSIITIGIAYDHNQLVNRLLKPVLIWTSEFMGAITLIIEKVFQILAVPARMQVCRQTVASAEHTIARRRDF